MWLPYSLPCGSHIHSHVAPILAPILAPYFRALNSLRLWLDLPRYTLSYIDKYCFRFIFTMDNEFYQLIGSLLGACWELVASVLGDCCQHIDSVLGACWELVYSKGGSHMVQCKLRRYIQISDIHS